MRIYPSHGRAAVLARRMLSAGALSVLVAVLAFVQNRLMVQALGAGEIVDRYYLLMTVPMAVVGVLSVVSVNLMAPTYGLTVTSEPLVGAGRAVAIATLAVVVALVVQVPLSVAGFWGPALADGQLGAIVLLCVGALGYGVSFAAQPLLVARGHTSAFVVAQVINAIVFITALAFGLGTSLTTLAGVFAAGAWAQALIAFVTLARLTRLDWSLRSALPVGLIARTRGGLAPILGAVVFLQMSTVVDRLFAGRLGTGVVTTYYVADRVVQMIVGVVAVAVGLVVFAELGEREDRRSSEVLTRAAGIVVSLLAPAAAALWLCGPALVELLFGGGRFDAGAVAASGVFLRYLAIALVPMALSVVLPRRLQAAGEYRLHMLVAFGVLIVNVTLKVVLVPILGKVALPLSVSVAYVIAVVSYVVLLVRRGLVTIDRAEAHSLVVPIALALGAAAAGSVALGPGGAPWGAAVIGVPALWLLASALSDGPERRVLSTFGRWRR